MNTVGAVNTIIHLLRAKRSKAEKKIKSKTALQLRELTRGSEKGMRPVLATRLEVLDLTHPEAEERAVDIFIETALSREFGNAFLQHESWQDLLVQVREAMLCTPDGRKAVLDMLRAVRQASKE